MIALAARVVLAGVLVVAAVGKLHHRKATRAEFGALLGPRTGPVVAAVLPYVELAVAVTLVVWWTAVPGVVAAVLLLAFTGVLVRAQLRGLPCACFGAASGAPVGGAAVLRNAVLLGLAILATATP